MKILKPTTKSQVYLAWLKSEYYKAESFLTEEERRIIRNPNLGDPEEDKLREAILLHRYERRTILNQLPEEIDWFEAEIEEGDIPQLFILPVFDWFLDTGGTFRLTDTLLNLSPSRGFRPPGGRTKADLHHGKVSALSTADNWPRDLIMISSSLHGPFTILDGTHRAVALLKNKRLPGAKVLWGKAADLSRCSWSIERIDLADCLARLRKLAALNLIW